METTVEQTVQYIRAILCLDEPKERELNDVAVALVAEFIRNDEAVDQSSWISAKEVMILYKMAKWIMEEKKADKH